MKTNTSTIKSFFNSFLKTFRPAAFLTAHLMKFTPVLFGIKVAEKSPPDKRVAISINEIRLLFITKSLLITPLSIFNFFAIFFI